MAAVRWFEYQYLAHVSRPKAVRSLYRSVKQLRASRIVEVGISDLRRTVALIRTAQRYAHADEVMYAGLDLFDARPVGQGPLTLKEAYQTLRRTGAAVRLVPGEPGPSLAAVANSLLQTDLLVIGSAISDERLAAAWFFVPRMLSVNSLVLREYHDALGEPAFARLPASEVAERAIRAAAARAA